MKKYSLATLAASALLFVIGCDTDYINDPDNPASAPSTQLFSNAQFDLAWELNDEWVAARGTLQISQYWNSTFYTDESRYALRTSMVDDMWEWPYRILTDLKEVIELNTDAVNAPLMLQYGSNNDQIQVSRILMAYTFSKLVDTFGDVPYWSYGQMENQDFQALRLKDGVTSPSYTDAETIYEDMLAELADAASKLDPSGTTMASGDNIYGGSNAKWIKFAHSLRLRLASHILDANPTLANSVFTQSDASAFTSNEDNALFMFGTTDIVGGPWHDAFTVNARRDFAPSLSFTELLYNRTGPFIGMDTDPRVESFFDTRLDATEVVGIPYGFGNTVARAVNDEGIPDAEILKPDFSQPILTYAEIEFIRSEFNGWDQASYENGVSASMEYWGIDATDVTAYISALPAASEETVLTQKYIGLYMDGLEGWTLYRRTGFPNTLTVPGDTFGDATFVTLVPGLDAIPSRVTYPQNEQLLNKSNWDAARGNLSDGDAMTSKIFWDVD
ncbi:SusD/RagB family nutrient-binding outer membrane lipoprotein [Zobellia amurskyensis]|uniref:SusD/RagB family nutrient-binding outer membrane lipoprotein n=1 Tax=Zobellia amurskyensis TaxID=248905 RepID=A0A7X3D102_9FLAO|nr:SusD/RagB family nutrient-binding outer membrane lipoprotein [Zobellia amurskyensis]MUH35644.1 SusD/RagB family nutrient-binding outer membrane lipoprotein [Zobellia amurskyensis]